MEDRREPPTLATVAGQKIHELLEVYLRDGTPIDTSATWQGYDIGLIAQDMTKYLPAAGSIQDVEAAFEFEYKGISYNGRIDGKELPKVWDHKTSSNLKYAKTEDELATDIQALVYAKAVLLEAFLDEAATLQWTYGQTKNEIKSKKVSLTLARDYVDAKFDEVVAPLAAEVAAHRAKGLESKSDCRKNDKACSKFPPRGCPFQKDCWSVTEETKPSLLEMLKASVAVDPINSPEVAKKVEVPPTLPLEVPKKARKARQEEPAPTSSIKHIRTLYVDCVPLTPLAGLVQAHVLIGAAAQTVCNDLHVPHYRLIDFKAGGCLAAQLKDDIEKLPRGFDLVLMSKTPEGRDVLQVLCDLAENVILGV